MTRQRWALVGATLIEPRLRSVAEGGVLIDGDSIVESGPAVRREMVGDVEVVDATGRFVMPGLIDTHIHLAFDGGPRPIERYLDEGIDDGFAARLAVSATTALLAGATTIRDLGGPDEELFALRGLIESGAIIGPRLLAAGSVLAPPGGHCHFIARLTESGGLDAAIEAQLDAGADCIKVMITGGVHTLGSSSADVYYDEEALRSAADITHRHGRRITGHVTNTTGIERALRAGFDSLQHGSALDEPLARLAADAGVTLVPTLGTHAAMVEHHGDPRIPGHVAQKAGQGTARKARAFGAALAAGVTVAAGSDGGVTFVGHGSLARELALMRASGLDAMTTLAAATSVAAVEVGLPDRIGSLAPGHAADLIVIDADPIADVRALERIGLVVSRGVIVARGPTAAAVGQASGVA